MKKICPLIKEECMEHGCTFYTHLLGKHPQTGADLDEFACSIQWLPVLIIENARATTGAQAAIESMRNEVVKRQDALNAAVDAAQQGRIGVGRELDTGGGSGNPTPKLRNGASTRGSVGEGEILDG